MRNLTIEEYKKESENWFTKHEEYFRKLVPINDKEREYICDNYDGNLGEYLKSEEAKEIDKQRLELKKKYKGFIDCYKDPDFYCLITKPSDVDEIIENIVTRNNFREELKNVGKLMEDSHGTVGIFDGIIVAIDDYYYCLREEKTGKKNWTTCVGHIEEYVEPNSYNIVTNGKDYI